jgi:hypothetical protein
MGFLDKAKRSLTAAVAEHGDRIEKGADQVGRIINQRTGNAHADKVAKGRASLHRALDSLDTGPEVPAPRRKPAAPDDGSTHP